MPAYRKQLRADIVFLERKTTSRISDGRTLRWVKSHPPLLIVDCFIAVYFLLTVSVLLSCAAEQEPAVNLY